MAEYELTDLADESKAVSEITKTLVDIYRFGKSIFDKKQIVKANSKTAASLYQKARTVELVKTIWQHEKEINLREFYYPSKVNIRDFKRDTTPNFVADISEKHNVIIEGTAGQGKSILLRYLASNELRTGNRIPIFIELRRLERAQSILDAIQVKLISLGFHVDNELLDAYFKSGKTLLLLDGFDELAKDKIRTVTNQIETFLGLYEKTQVVVTSRPNNAIQSSALFRVVKIAELTERDHLPFLKRICHDEDTARTIDDAIKSSRSDVKKLLKTPLLLTLLTIVFNAEQTIPSNFTDFYEKLFQVLYTRHDSSKPGFKRKKKTNLSEEKLEKAFSTYCFLARKIESTSIAHVKALELASDASDISGIDFNSDDFLEDIVKITCLLIDEGFEYHFIHKSVQEFFSARFIKSLPSKAAEKFYNNASTNFLFWSQELLFLKSIDPYRSLKFFFIPELRNYLKKYNSTNCFNELTDRFQTQVELGREFSTYSWVDYEPIEAIYQSVFSKSLQEAFSSTLKKVTVDESIYGQARILSKDVKDQGFVVTIGSPDRQMLLGLTEALEITETKSEFNRIIKRYFRFLEAELASYEEEVQRQDRLEALMDF